MTTSFEHLNNKPILVASATATTATATITALVEMGAPSIRALVRKLDDPRSMALAKLAGVTLVQGDFDDHESIAKAVTGVSRALLVSDAFSYAQFEREVFFVETAEKAGVDCVVRVSTASGLIKPGTKGAYGRAHHGIQAFCEAGNHKVVHLNPNWYMSNWLGSATEAKASGTITLPVTGDGPKVAMIDPRDIGTAAAIILTLPDAGLQPFLKKMYIEIHGPAKINFDDKAAALSKACGYPIKINTIPREPFLGALLGMGIPRVFANSYLETMEQIGGVTPPGYPAIKGGGDDFPQATSAELAAVWKPKYDVGAWAASPTVQAAFAK